MVRASLEGFLISAGLIIAIGAQNAFVLRQGLLRQHVLAVVLFCALSDAMLILLGVAGFGTIVRSSTVLLTLVRWGGAAFLAAYAMLALRRAWRPLAMTAADGQGPTRGAALLQCAAFTWANPHVYLDTVVLLGGISATYPESLQTVFAAGAAAASFAWFFALGYGARLLSAVFERPRAWQILDLGIAFVMAAIAFKIAAMPL